MNIFGRKIYLLEIIIAGMILLLMLVLRNAILGIVIEDKDGCKGGYGFREIPPIVSIDILAMRQLALQEEDLRPYTDHTIRCERYVRRDDIPLQTSPIDGLRVSTWFRSARGGRPPSGGIHQTLLKYSSEEHAAEAFLSEAATHTYRREMDNPENYSFQQAVHDCGIDSVDQRCEIVTQYGQYVSIIYLGLRGPVRPMFEDMVEASDLRLRHLSHITTDDD